MQCIYCNTTKLEMFSGKEHVIPQSFGTFSSDTPTLHCVCDVCNAYFSRELDQGLARDTLEGVTRYKKGMLSSQRQFPKNVQFSLEETEENGEYGGAIIGGYDPLSGKLLPMVSQFWILNIKTNKWERYRKEQIKDIKIDDVLHGSVIPGSRQMRVMAPSRQEYNNVIAELKKYNIPYRGKEKLGELPFLKTINPEGKIEVRGTVKGTVDKNKKRAFTKILFNFAAYFIGEEEVRKPEWDKMKNFIRYDGEELLCQMTAEPFWTGQETEQMRFADDSYNLRIENKNKNVHGVIQLFNLYTYEFILIENYSLPPEKEIAYRFTPGQNPYIGIKLTTPKMQPN